MLYVTAETITQAWRKACKTLYNEGSAPVGGEIFRDASVTVEVHNVYTDLFDNRFPMTKEQVETISTYLLTGKNDGKVTHEWTKLYRKRLFDDEVNQIERIVAYLKDKPLGKRAQASIWQAASDFTGGIAPCLQVLWFQVVAEKVDLHVHMRASDCYGKLLMNMHEFSALQRFVAEQLGRKAGSYIQFIDTCHFNTTDEHAIEKLLPGLQ